MERFIVGTGRCGSTLLSRMVGLHPEALSIHEFFTGLGRERRFREGSVPAAELVQILSADQFVTTQMIALGYRAEEVQYPLGKGRYRPGDALPWLLIGAIPRLCDDPDALYDELIAFAARRPAATMREHYLALFGWLADRLRRPLWIERSGASIEYLGSLVDLYPEARFVHIHRDGLEAALSIQAHPYFRAAIALAYGLLGPRTDLREDLRRAAETPPPLWAVGRFWSEQVLRGVSALPRLDRSQYLTVRFEDLIARPREVLGEIARFFELPQSDGFLDRASALVAEAPPPRLPALSPAEQEELSAACRPGQLALGRAS